MKKIFIGCVLIFLILTILFPLTKADTGTYEITKQYVDLTVNLNSNVNIKYEITMKVTGGNIPWLTVGLPNSNYVIGDYGGSAKTCKSDNSGSWTGVRIDLDKTYYSGDSFTCWFTATQKQFVYEYKDNQSSIQFTPCWWDNAVIKDLKVTFHLPNEIKQVLTTKEGATFGTSVVTWQWSNVPKGQKYTVGFIMDRAPFTNLGKDSNINFNFDLGIIWALLFVGALIVIIGIALKAFSGRSDYDEPSVSVSAPEKKTRHINMDCPNDGTRLEKKTIEGVTIDYCPKCEGIYFDKGEVESLINKDINETVDGFMPKKSIPSRTLKAKEVTLAIEKTTETNLKKCLRCEEDIKRVSKTVNGKELNIYACEECGGIWANKGVYQAIKDKRIEQIELADKKLEQARTLHPGERLTRSAYYDDDWWLFHPYIYYPRSFIFIPPRSSSSSSTSSSSGYHSSCACVSCACVAACACACACAGGGAAGCSPKDKISQIHFNRVDR